ncbi:MAG: 4Fe-4S dicluster domain-containing protein [Bacteroidetes bacterium]|nr:4Fe-4S dicluster domain-containing protein [Bacteroidota bacterium]
MGLVTINDDKCKLSYACVRVCPVKAIEVRSDKEFPRIIPERCIGCGSCIQACSQHAISYKSDNEVVKSLIDAQNVVIAILAPEISAEFGDVTDYRKFVNMIKKLGFDFVCEASFGVDLVAARYLDLFTQFKGKYYITANCPAIVSFVEKFHPTLVDNLAPIVSPMIAMTRVIRDKYGEGVKVVYIGPCISAKMEASQYQDSAKVDAILTFSELREMFNEYNISESTLEFSDFDPPFGFKGALYPISNGILQAGNISEDLMTSHIITTEGRENSVESLKSFENQLDIIKHHFNLFYCEGCLAGPGMSRDISKFVRRSWVVDYATKRVSQIDLEEWKTEMEKYATLDLDRKFTADDRRLPFPDEKTIDQVLKVLGKSVTEDEIGCGTCGYGSCREFAVAVAQGLAKTEMCLTFSLRNRQEYIKTLKQTNEKLAKTQEALKQSERQARVEQQLAKEAMETTSAMLQKLPSGVVIVDDKMKIIQSNGRFIEILGREAEEINDIIPGLTGADLKTLIPYPFYNLFSYVIDKDDDVINRDVHYEDRILNVSVFTIRKSKVVGAVVRDMYMPEVRKEEVIRRVTEAIDENLELVQKIAFLLGEGASKTEKILNSIIEVHQNDKKEPKA